MMRLEKNNNKNLLVVVVVVVLLLLLLLLLLNSLGLFKYYIKLHIDLLSYIHAPLKTYSCRTILLVRKTWLDAHGLSSIETYHI